MTWLAIGVRAVVGTSYPWMPDLRGGTPVELRADPYHSEVNATRVLVRQPIPRLDTEVEGGVYWWFMERLLFPRDFLLEASAPPLPVRGREARRVAPYTGEDARIEFHRAELPRPRAMRWSALVGERPQSRSGIRAFARSIGVEPEVGTGSNGALQARAPRGRALLLRPNVEW